jgi:hypothetical protein
VSGWRRSASRFAHTNEALSSSSILRFFAKPWVRSSSTVNGITIRSIYHVQNIINLTSLARSLRINTCAFAYLPSLVLPAGLSAGRGPIQASERRHIARARYPGPSLEPEATALSFRATEKHRINATEEHGKTRINATEEHGKTRISATEEHGTTRISATEEHGTTRKRPWRVGRMRRRGQRASCVSGRARRIQ